MNSFGRVFRVTIFGESHGAGVGVSIDGCPAGLPLEPGDFEKDMSRRRSGAKGTTPRKEEDLPGILSGVFEDRTTGAPLTLWIGNKNVRSKDYTRLRETPRPGHADFVAEKKFGGYQDYRGGGTFFGSPDRSPGCCRSGGQEVDRSGFCPGRPGRSGRREGH